MLLPIGTIFIDKYEILELLSSSSLNYVYKAMQKPLDRLVILKILTPTVATNSEIVGRFEREAKLLSSVKEEGVTKVYDFGKHNGLYYIVSEYVEGMSIRELLNQKGRIPLPLAAYIVLETAKILNRLHLQGIIHRDIKPENIIISNENRIKLTDFGLAFSQAMPSITVDGSILGTPAYMSPEQIVGKQVDKKSDIYSLGVVFYELLTGINPFIADNYSAIMHKVLNLKPIPIHQIDKSLEMAKDIWPIIESMLSKESSTRYQDLSEVITKLESLLNTNKPNLSLIANLPKQSILRGVNKLKLKTLVVYIVSIIIFILIALSVWYKIPKSGKVLTNVRIEKPNFLSSQETVLITKPNINQTAKETMLTIIPDKKNSILPQNSINNETGSVK
ncbi:MAG: serine/threonine-protein kinase, partial [candidate division WOR-3 bacterium]